MVWPTGNRRNKDMHIHWEYWENENLIMRKSQVIEIFLWILNNKLAQRKRNDFCALTPRECGWERRGGLKRIKLIPFLLFFGTFKKLEVQHKSELFLYWKILDVIKGVFLYMHINSFVFACSTNPHQPQQSISCIVKCKWQNSLGSGWEIDVVKASICTLHILN